MTVSNIITWGILGTGAIARSFAATVNGCAKTQLVAVGSRSPGAVTSPEDFGGARLAGYAELIEDPAIQAIYIALPHTEHARWTIRALEAGKHVLCEKPLALTASDAEAVIDCAARNDRLLVEGFMYRFHPQIADLRSLIADGEIGEIATIHSEFGFAAEPDSQSRLYRNDLGGGALLDIGCYPLSLSRLIAGAAIGRDFAEVTALAATAVIGDTGVDKDTSATITFAGGAVATLRTSIRADLDHRVTVTGSKGSITLASPWLPGLWGLPEASLVLTGPGGTSKRHDYVPVADPYLAELEYFCALLAAGQHSPAIPAASAADSLENMRLLDLWRKAIGLVFSAEQPEARRERFSTRALRPQQPLLIPQSDRLPGAKRASSIALGACDIQDIVHGDHLYDAFFEAGGTVFDTAWIYEESDTALGQWMDHRGLREEVIVVGKGAHSPDCFPSVIAPQLDESLAKLRSDYLDVYMLHRDNPDVPVAEFIDALDEEYRKGRIRQFGFSNWTRDRFDAAVDYAKRSGKAVPNVLSNNFSLAEMAEPVWEGCIASSDADWAEWLQKRDVSLLAWSSQARGFFADRTARDPLADPNFARSWETPVNLERRNRARVIAERKGARTTHVALAWILHQPLPVIPIIGPLTIAQLRDSLKAVTLELTLEEVSWLAASEPAA